MKVVDKMKKIITNALTNKTIAKMNARISAWEKKGVSQDIINQYIGQVSKINGIDVVDRKRGAKGKRLAATQDLNNRAISDLEANIPTWTDVKKIEKSVAAEMQKVVDKDIETRRQLEAELRFKAEVKLMRNKAAEDLWDQWYEGDTHKDKDKNNWVNNQSIYGIKGNVQSTLRQELRELGAMMGKDKASAEEIWEFQRRVQYAIENGKLPED